MNKLYSGLRSNPINQQDNYSNYESIVYTFSGNVIDKINKKDSQYTVPTAKEGLVYTGQEQILINAGSTTTGTVKYSSDNINWSTTVPSGTNAGTYTLYWKVVGDIDHNDTESTTITTSISKITPTYTAPTGKENLQYTGGAQALLNAGSTSNGTIKYSLDGTNWSTSVPTGTEAQTYTVYWKLEGDANHNDVAQATISVEITSVAPTVEFVDLGLPSGLKWAKTNLGATNEEDAGLYYAWGETTGYADANARNAALGGTDGFGETNYTNGGASGISANLAASQDAANAAYGGNWRMPTQAELEELIANTNYEWTTINGVAGRKFTNKNDSTKYIFIPASGRYGGTSLISNRSNGYYWSSTHSDSPYAYNLYFDSSNVSTGANSRRNGMTVRAVQPAV